MNRVFLALYQGVRLRKGAAPLLLMSLLIVSAFAFVVTVGAQNDPLTATSPEFSKVRNCPEGIELRLPSRVVLQYIDGVFHKWEEHDLDVGGSYCIILRKPEQRRLSAGEAKNLLENSARWREQAPPPGISQTLAPDDPRLQKKPVEPRRREEIQQKNGPVSQEPDKPAPRGYPIGEPRSESQLQRFSSSHAENVVGTDDRVRVTDTTTYPWNTVGYIGNSYPSGSASRGTGAIVSPYMVLTGGHMVYSLDDGGYVSALNFAPGQKQLSAGGAVTRPYGQFTAASWVTNQNYIDALKNPVDEFMYDYGAVFFNTSFASVGLTTYMPVVFNISPAVGDIINLAGFPASVQGETNSQAMWLSSGGVNNVTDRILYYDADTTGGNSGGPVWQLISGQRRIIAIHVVSTPGGCRLVSQNQALVESWMQWEPACTYTLSPSSASYGVSGGTGSMSLTTNKAGCTWTAASDSPSWITVISGNSGTGSGTINYAVSANSGSSKSGSITVAGQIFSITVAGQSQSAGSSGDSGGGGCFIATAAYGSYLDPHVQTLRRFRDRHLLTNGPGRAFVRFYNDFSPPVAALIQDSLILRAASRILLTPMVYAIGYPAVFSGLFFLAILLAMAIAYRRRFRAPQSPITG